MIAVLTELPAFCGWASVFAANAIAALSSDIDSTNVIRVSVLMKRGWCIGILSVGGPGRDRSSPHYPQGL